MNIYNRFNPTGKTLLIFPPAPPPPWPGLPCNLFGYFYIHYTGSTVLAKGLGGRVRGVNLGWPVTVVFVREAFLLRDFGFF